jgi:hypothetical protein
MARYFIHKHGRTSRRTGRIGPSPDGALRMRERCTESRYIVHITARSVLRSQARPTFGTSSTSGQVPARGMDAKAPWAGVACCRYSPEQRASHLSGAPLRRDRLIVDEVPIRHRTLRGFSGPSGQSTVLHSHRRPNSRDGTRYFVHEASVLRPPGGSVHHSPNLGTSFTRSGLKMLMNQHILVL